jgi:hypothetical protein
VAIRLQFPPTSLAQTLTKTMRYLRPSTFLCILFFAAAAAAAKPRVEVEIAMEPGMSGNAAAQKWVKVLNDAGIADVHFRGSQDGDRVAVESKGSGASAVVKVAARITSRGALKTSGGEFTYSDGPKLKKWLDEVQASGGLPQPKTVFGLTAKQFEDVKKSLAAPVVISTKGMRPEKVVEQLRANSKLPLSIDPTIAQAMAADDPVRDELDGVSLGAALAAIARPAGGVLAPQAGANGLELVISEPKPGGDMWPIGWPPQENDQSKLIPKLLEFTDVEIDLPLADVLKAIQERLKVPFLFDHNNIVRQKIDLTKTVKIPATKTFYRKILDRVLSQAGLKCELRVDDAGKPLIWISPL